MKTDDILTEIEGIVDNDCLSEGELPEDGWTEDLMVYAAALLIEEFGEDVLTEGKIITIDTATEMGVKVGDFFVPPAFITDTPFTDSTKWWWEAVTEILKKGDAFDDKGRPNYGAVVSLWKNKVESEFGFRPTRSKERSMKQDISKAVSTAARTLAKKRRGHPADKEALRRAGKLMAGQRIRRRRVRRKDGHDVKAAIS